MELSQEEKERIVAEEKARLEAKAEYLKEFKGRGCHGGHGCGGWCGHRGELVKGILLGILLSLAFGFFFHHHHHHRGMGWHQGFDGGQGWGHPWHQGHWGQGGNPGGNPPDNTQK